MSLMMFAGAAQLAVIELAKTEAPWAVMVAVAITINLRFAMYSAGLSGWSEGRPRWARVLLSYLLTDHAFAVTTTEAADREEAERAKRESNRNSSEPVSQLDHAETTSEPLSTLKADSEQEKNGEKKDEALVWFFAGAAVTLWAAWQGGTGLGAAIGKQAPTELGLDLVAPLAFVALGATALRSKADGVGAAAALAAYGGLFWLPYGLGLIPAAAVGVGVRQWSQNRGQA